MYKKLKNRIEDMFAFVEKQILFIKETTSHLKSTDDFLSSQSGTILYNSTCMCLQTIGETLKQVDNLTQQQMLRTSYPAVPWRGIWGLRNIISHEYMATDPDEIFSIVRNDLDSLLQIVQKMRKDLQSGILDGWLDK